MSALLDSLASAFQGDAQRKVALDVVLHDGLPGPRSEAWKYTSLRALERRAFAVPRASAVAGFDTSLLSGIPAPRLVFVNGRHAPAHSDIAGLPAGVVLEACDDMSASIATDAGPSGDDVFARLSAALAKTGVVLRVDPGIAIESVVHLVFVGMPAQEDLAWHLRHRIVLGERASLTLVEHHVAGGVHRHLDNSGMDIRLGAGARLDHARVQHDADGATRFLRTDAVLADTATYTRIDVELGSALSRHELAVRLEGKDARLNANGILLANGRRHLDTRLAIEHIARDTTCDLLWRGIGADRGRAVFHGGITIQPGADGSDANLSNKNLLLGEQAEIDTQPVLVIHADEVKAAHGATVGQLDPTAMFYLRSRGLPEAQARRLLTTAFAREPLLAIAAPQVRELLQARIDAALGAIAGA